MRAPGHCAWCLAPGPGAAIGARMAPSAAAAADASSPRPDGPREGQAGAAGELQSDRAPPFKLLQARAPRCSCGSAAGGSANVARRAAGPGPRPGGGLGGACMQPKPCPGALLLCMQPCPRGVPRVRHPSLQYGTQSGAAPLAPPRQRQQEETARRGARSPSCLAAPA